MSGVYRIACCDCDAIYLGQTGRSLKKRLIEHDKSIFKNIRNTGFAEHCIKYNHSLDPENVQLLHHSGKGKALNLLEIIEIKKAENQQKNLTNDYTEFSISPLIKSVI